MAKTHAITLRIARLTLGKTKDEVKEIIRKADDPLMEEIFDRLKQPRKRSIISGGSPTAH